MPDYYKAWDKFAKKLDEDDDETNEAATNPKAVPTKEPANAAEMM
jgi:hypothetical protein